MALIHSEKTAVQTLVEAVEIGRIDIICTYLEGRVSRIVWGCKTGLKDDYMVFGPNNQNDQIAIN